MYIHVYIYIYTDIYIYTYIHIHVRVSARRGMYTASQDTKSITTQMSWRHIPIHYTTNQYSAIHLQYVC